ncbi:response regulator transcription factor [Oscillibacter sp.]|uniref:response regulator n=1 Tax=Oscillibacter sp. TaxID=1945593 RepID=UPI002898F92D|nr:response regulator transcription factor [Oscillibacter sp.]
MILILDDHPLARAGLASVIRMYRPAEDMVQAGCVREAMDQMNAAAADMAFVDVNLGKENGFSFVEWLQKQGFDTKAFFITSSSRESDFLAARELGVNAYVLKDLFLMKFCMVCGWWSGVEPSTPPRW